MHELAQETRGMEALTRSLSRANPAIVRALNAKRRAMGLEEVRTAGDPSTPLVMERSDGSTYTVPTPADTARRLWALKARAVVAIGRLRAASETNLVVPARRCR